MFELIKSYFISTPVEVILAYMLFILGPVGIFWVMLKGFWMVWVGRKQDQFAMKRKWHLYEIHVPPDSMQSPMGMVNFFKQIAGSKSSITWKEANFYGKFQAIFSFEIAGSGGDIRFYVRTDQKYIDLIQGAFYAQYPEAQFLEVEDYTKKIPTEWPQEEYDLFGSEMVLRKPSYLPIKTYEMFEHQGEKDGRFKDPMLTLFELMGRMKSHEHYWMQLIIMQPNEQHWRDKGAERIDDLYGKAKQKKKSFYQKTIGWLVSGILEDTLGIKLPGSEGGAEEDNFKMFKITPEERTEIDGIQKKLETLGWKSKVRFVYWARKDQFRKGTIAAMTKGYFHQYRHMGWNNFGIHVPATTKDDYFWMQWQMPGRQRTISKRYQSRSFSPGCTPYILTCEELATMFHFPAADARTPVLRVTGARRAEPPVDLDFAGEDVPTLPNVDAAPTDAPKQKQRRVRSGPLTVPTPSAPTGPSEQEEVKTEDIAEAQKKSPESRQDHVGMPKVGMPAPLPPGLDISDEPVDRDQATPTNLPM